MITVLTQRLMKYSLQWSNKVASKLPLPRRHYFAYGANMDPNFLRRKSVYPRRSEPAALANMALSISSPCEYLGKGFASIAPMPDAYVCGVVHDISMFEGLLIDVFEWVPFRFHRRRRGSVLTLNSGETVAVFYYEAVNPQEGLSTSSGYRNLLVGAATLYSFPASYVEHLKSLPTAAQFELDHGFRLSNAGKRRWLEKKLIGIYRIHDQWREKLCDKLP